MKLLNETYRTKGYFHLLRKRYRSIYIYEKFDISTGELRCYEIFKARIRPAGEDSIVPVNEDSHRYPRNEDFGCTAFCTLNLENALKRFESLKEKYYG